jgi:hypothetical protein
MSILDVPKVGLANIFVLLAVGIIIITTNPLRLAHAHCCWFYLKLVIIGCSLGYAKHLSKYCVILFLL